MGNLHCFLGVKTLKFRVSLGCLPANLQLLNKQPYHPNWHCGLIQWTRGISCGATVHVKLQMQNVRFP